MVGLAMELSFSSSLSRSSYPHLHQKNPTLHYTWARFGRLHLTGVCTNTHLPVVHKNLLLDIALSRNHEFDRHYPAYMADEFLDLLGNIFEGQTSSHIDKAAHQLASIPVYARSGFYDRLFNLITGTQALPQSL
jgi:hypothetical protein